MALNQPAPDGAKFGAELVSMGLVLFPFVNHGFEPYLNPPLWSLGVEIWFSVIFPLARILALRRPRRGAACCSWRRWRSAARPARWVSC